MSETKNSKKVQYFIKNKVKFAVCLTTKFTSGPGTLMSSYLSLITLATSPLSYNSNLVILDICVVLDFDNRKVRK